MTIDPTLPPGACAVEPVAHSEVGHVAVCRGCGQVHLSLQYLTLRLEHEAFVELASMVLDARVALHGPRARRAVATRAVPPEPDEAADAGLH